MLRMRNRGTYSGCLHGLCFLPSGVVANSPTVTKGTWSKVFRGVSVINMGSWIFTLTILCFWQKSLSFTKSVTCSLIHGQKYLSRTLWHILSSPLLNYVKIQSDYLYSLFCFSLDVFPKPVSRIIISFPSSRRQLIMGFGTPSAWQISVTCNYNF